MMGALGVTSAEAGVVADPGRGAELRAPPHQPTAQLAQHPSPQPPSPSPPGTPPPESAATALKNALQDIAGDMQYYGAGIGVVGVVAMAGPGLFKPAGACVAAGGAFIAMGGMWLDRTTKQLFPGQRSVRTIRSIAALRHAARQRIGKFPRRLRGVAAAVIALRDNVAQLEPATLALTTAVDAAAAAQNDEERLSELETAAENAQTVAELLDEAPALRERFAAALTAARVRFSLTAGQLASLDRTVARRGLPRRLIAALRRFGAPDSWIAEYDAAARLAGPVAPQLEQVVQGPADITSLLNDASLTARQQVTATALRDMAAVWQPAT
jgi:hypothetical protein